MSKFDESWKEHWKDMPEYIQDDKGAIKKVTISFETLEDIEKFNEITGLKVTLKTKGVFFPKKETPKIIYKHED